ncbi:MAG: malate synthase G [Candidatus Marinimicrobia bacterium]|nr:malate synthase G [Candidatus Neomarinimicrobiota bacterium]
MIKKNNLTIDEKLYNFVNEKVIPETNLDIDKFWNDFSNIVDELDPINKSLINKRSELQSKLNEWYKNNKGKEINITEYKKFLLDIDYLIEEGDDFKIDTKNVDPEIASICGPQLVVPITNARYSLNAINARWGSFYDSIYGTNVLGDLPTTKEYDIKRGDRVIKFAKDHLDKIVPLKLSSWNQVSSINYINNKINFDLSTNKTTTLVDENQIAGIRLNVENQLSELILIINNLHCRILINRNNVIGKTDPAGISDIVLESAISSILDCEDSVATVDANDKVLAYENLLGLMKGNLESKFTKNNKKITRVLNQDIKIKTLNGEDKILKGRSLMLVRNVGHLMTTPVILNKDNIEIGEGIMDGVITALIAIHDLKKTSNQNSIYNSIYIVKPKMHGPKEVEFTVNLFKRIEEILNLPNNTIKVGIMDEERRTSINLKECIRAAKSRLAFINTGFLDRTGDEIHTSTQAGSFITKADMKNAAWIKSYEDRNVDIGLECGLKGKAQIGKGMWAMPDLMLEMVEQKISHPKAGANCSWVPSPTAATLHAMHYHYVNVFDIQDKIRAKGKRGTLNDLLTLPLLNKKNLSEEEINKEIENNAQGILGYVVRWIDQGIGCSKVPDINNIGLMEDRATCRISSQAIVNWIASGLITKDQALNALKKMAAVVDKQNIGDKKYIPMSPNYNTIAFEAAKELVFDGINQPSGYTEPILHKRRLEFKSQNKI